MTQTPQDRYGQTPLHFAAKYGHASNVQLLLQRDATVVYASDRYGRTPPFQVAENGHTAAMALLLAAASSGSGSADTKNVWGCTLLLRAAGHGHSAAVQQLLDADSVVLIRAMNCSSRRLPGPPQRGARRSCGCCLVAPGGVVNDTTLFVNGTTLFTNRITRMNE